MPATSELQRGAAGSELGKRRGGVKKQKKKSRKKRAFGTATIAQLRDFARRA